MSVLDKYEEVTRGDATNQLVAACRGDRGLALGIWQEVEVEADGFGDVIVLWQLQKMLDRAPKWAFTDVPVLDVTNADTIEAYMARVEFNRMFPHVNTRKTGFEQLDKKVEIEPGTVTTIIAPPGAGKSAFGFQAAVNLSSGGPVIYVLTEMSREQCMTRLISQVAHLDIHHVRYPENTAMVEKIREAALWCKDHVNVRIIDARGRNLSFIEHELRTYHAESGSPRAVIIDNLWGIVNSSGVSSDPNAQSRGIGAIVQSISSLAQTAPTGIDTAIILVHHTKAVAGLDPGTDDAGGSVGIKQFSDIIIQLVEMPLAGMNDDVFGTSSTSETHRVWVKKNREGPKDWFIPLHFVGSEMRFIEVGAPVRSAFYQVEAPNLEFEAKRRAAEEELPSL